MSFGLWSGIAFAQSRGMERLIRNIKMRQSGIISCVIGACITVFFAAPSEAAAQSRNGGRAPAGAKVVARSAKEYIGSLRKVANETEGDSVSDYDKADEITGYMENRLAEAYASLLYEAIQSSDQARFFKKLSKVVSKEQKNQMQRVLNGLRTTLSQKDGELMVQQQILEQAESLARKDISLAKKSFEKEFRTLVTEKNRERRKELPGA
ncbi:MAG: hypothetical protein IPK68_00900 [Bdellovibrionales bacterium]|nr:hypothetical protein [Bdellovibrionales bacterium]